MHYSAFFFIYEITVQFTVLEERGAVMYLSDNQYKPFFLLCVVWCLCGFCVGIKLRR